MNAASSPSPRPLAGLRILLAEDSWHLAMALRQTLEHAGATIAGIASTVAHAERLSRSARFEAAVMDLNLHDEMTTSVISRLARNGIKVVVISGYDLAPELAEQVHASFGKPAPGDDLVKALQAPLRQT